MLVIGHKPFSDICQYESYGWRLSWCIVLCCVCWKMHGKSDMLALNQKGSWQKWCCKHPYIWIMLCCPVVSQSSVRTASFLLWNNCEKSSGQLNLYEYTHFPTSSQAMYTSLGYFSELTFSWLHHKPHSTKPEASGKVFAWLDVCVIFPVFLIVLRLNAFPRFDQYYISGLEGSVFMLCFMNKGS